jgi:hypothetical protein
VASGFGGGLLWCGGKENEPLPSKCRGNNNRRRIGPRYSSMSLRKRCWRSLGAADLEGAIAWYVQHRRLLVPAIARIDATSLVKLTLILILVSYTLVDLKVLPSAAG